LKTCGSESSDLLTAHASISFNTPFFREEDVIVETCFNSLTWRQFLSRDTWSRTESGKIVQHLSNVKHADTTRTSKMHDESTPGFQRQGNKRRN